MHEAAVLSTNSAMRVLLGDMANDMARLKRLLSTTRAEVADLRRSIAPAVREEELEDAEALALGSPIPGRLVPIEERVTWAPDDEYHDPMVGGSMDRAEDRQGPRRRLEDDELEAALAEDRLFRGEDLPEYTRHPEDGNVTVPGIPVREPMTHSLPTSRAASPTSSSE